MRSGINFIAIALILFLGILFHKNYINEFPSYVHAWAQADRYALARGFVNNDLNFFKPETFVLNHQFPGDFKLPGKKSITAVDFPMHDFIPAVAMKLTGNQSPWLFRSYILLYSFIGLFFLFKLSMLLTNDNVKSFFLVIFSATSPVFVYYQSGFLPTVPSLSNAIIGLFFYVRYVQNARNKDFNLSICFLALATLSRTTFAIPFLAVLGIEFLRILRKKSLFKPKLLIIVLSLSVILFFYFYNAYLRNRYGSLFLNHFLPAKNVREAIEIITIVKDKWLFEYFSKTHFVIYFLLIATFIITTVTKRIQLTKKDKTFIFLSGIMLVGCIAFALLMLRQFPAHDYYFLDTFYLPVILILTVVLAAMPKMNTQKSTIIGFIIIGSMSIPMAVNALHTQKERRITGSWDRTMATINNYKGSSQFLDSLQISKDAKILVIDGYAPNIPFLLMDRKGYVILSTTRENMGTALNWEYDFISIQNEFFLSDIYSVFPEIVTRIEKIADNGRISICRLNSKSRNRTSHDFMGISKMKPVFQVMFNFDSIANESWSNVNIVSEHSFSGKNAGILTSDQTYGLTYKTKHLSSLKEKKRLVHFSSCFQCDTIASCEIVLAINENGQNTYYKSYKLSDFLRSTRQWEKVDLIFEVPQVKSDDHELALYIWNTGKINLLMDDFGFKIY